MVRSVEITEKKMTHKSTSCVKSIFQNSQAHRRTGLEILGGQT